MPLAPKLQGLAKSRDSEAPSLSLPRFNLQDLSTSQVVGFVYSKYGRSSKRVMVILPQYMSVSMCKGKKTISSVSFRSHDARNLRLNFLLQSSRLSFDTARRR